VLDGPPGTPYNGGSFRVKLVLSKDYPVSPPKGFFLTKIFHPNVGPQGEICVNTLKKDWKPDLGIKVILKKRSYMVTTVSKIILADYGTGTGYRNFVKRYINIV
jgi:ubiquitin-protein ligase